MMSTTNVLRSDRDNAVLVLTLNRPDSRNALNIELTRAFESAVAAYEADDSLRGHGDTPLCVDRREFTACDHKPRGM